MVGQAVIQFNMKTGWIHFDSAGIILHRNQRIMLVGLVATKIQLQKGNPSQGEAPRGEGFPSTSLVFCCIYFLLDGAVR